MKRAIVILTLLLFAFSCVALVACGEKKAKTDDKKPGAEKGKPAAKAPEKKAPEPAAPPPAPAPPADEPKPAE